QRAELRVRHVRDEDVLAGRGAEHTRAVPLGEAGQLRELVAGHAPDGRLEPDVAQPGLTLAIDADVIRRAAAPRITTGSRERTSEACLERFTESGHPPLGDEKSHARLA